MGGWAPLRKVVVGIFVSVTSAVISAVLIYNLTGDDKKDEEKKPDIYVIHVDGKSGTGTNGTSQKDTDVELEERKRREEEAKRTSSIPSNCYRSRIGKGDHWNINGDRIKNAAIIIRQDRQYYNAGQGDPEDTQYLGLEEKEARERLQKQVVDYMESNNVSLKEIVNKEPLIQVCFVRDKITIEVLEE